MARQEVVSTDLLLESIKESVKANVRQETLEEVIAKCHELLGTAVAAPVKGKRGRKPGSKNKVATVSKKPQGETYKTAGRGRKQCPNCQLYTAARSEVCPNCWYNFKTESIMSYGDDHPPMKSSKAKAKVAKADKPAKTKVAKVAKSDKEFGSKIEDSDMDKSVKKILSKSNDPLTFKEITPKVLALLSLADSPSRAFLMRLQWSLKRVGLQDAATKKWSKTKAA